jgi:hypothetical protein
MKTLQELICMIEEPYSLTIERDRGQWKAIIRGFPDMLHKSTSVWHINLRIAVEHVLQSANLFKWEE